MINPLDYVLQDELPQPFIEFEGMGNAIITYLHKKEKRGVNRISSRVATYFIDPDGDTAICVWALLENNLSVGQQQLNIPVRGQVLIPKPRDFKNLLRYVLAGSTYLGGDQLLSKPLLVDTFSPVESDGLYMPSFGEGNFTNLPVVVGAYFMLGIAAGHYKEDIQGAEDQDTPEEDPVKESHALINLLAPSFEGIDRMYNMLALYENHGESMDENMRETLARNIETCLQGFKNHDSYPELEKYVRSIVEPRQRR